MSPNNTLPDMLVGSDDLAAAENQLDTVQEFFKATSQRQAGQAVQLPKGTKLVENIAASIGLNLLNEADRTKLAEYLQGLQKAPSIRLSLASEPTATMQAKLVSWLRLSVNPQLLVNITVQPGLGAGAVLHTPKNTYDFSLRKHFTASGEILADLLTATQTAS